MSFRVKYMPAQQTVGNGNFLHSGRHLEPVRYNLRRFHITGGAKCPGNLLLATFSH